MSFTAKKIDPDLFHTHIHVFRFQRFVTMVLVLKGVLCRYS